MHGRYICRVCLDEQYSGCTVICMYLPQSFTSHVMITIVFCQRAQVFLSIHWYVSTRHLLKSAIIECYLSVNFADCDTKKLLSWLCRTVRSSLARTRDNVVHDHQLQRSGGG